MEGKHPTRPGPRRTKSLGSTPVKSKDRKSSSAGLNVQNRRKGLIKKHKKAEHERKQLKQKMTFKLGGNKVDPLNLMGLAVKEGGSSPKVDSPFLSARGDKFEPGDLRPVDVTDPLKLNNLEDEVLNVKAHSNKKRRKRKRRHTITETEDDAADKSATEGNISDALVMKDAEGFVSDVRRKTENKQQMSLDEESKVHHVTESLLKNNSVCDIEGLSESGYNKIENNQTEEEIKVIKSSPNKKKHFKAEKPHKKKNSNIQEQSRNEQSKTCNRTFREKDCKYKYGNYNRYYGYRNSNMTEDERIENFQKDWFEGKSCLDIGCNVGHLTLYIARHFNPRSLLGVDIDDNLIRAARNNIRNYLPSKAPQAPPQSEFPISFALCHGPLAAPLLPDKEGKSFGFPYNVAFKTENYIDCQWSELDKVTSEYDSILCLSVTKWVHLNWGDDGLKKMFKKMFLSLKSNGKLLLEPQPWKSYSKKKNLTQSIRETFNSIKFKPDQFIQYLLSPEVGFAKSELLGVPKHKAQGFQRPIYLLTKGGCATNDSRTDLQAMEGSKENTVE